MQFRENIPSSGTCNRKLRTISLKKSKEKLIYSKQHETKLGLLSFLSIFITRVQTPL